MPNFPLHTIRSKYSRVTTPGSIGYPARSRDAQLDAGALQMGPQRTNERNLAMIDVFY